MITSEGLYRAPGAPPVALSRYVPRRSLTQLVYLEHQQEPSLATFLDVSWREYLVLLEDEAAAGGGGGQQVAGVGGDVG